MAHSRQPLSFSLTINHCVNHCISQPLQQHQPLHLRSYPTISFMSVVTYRSKNTRRPGGLLIRPTAHILSPPKKKVFGEVWRPLSEEISQKVHSRCYQCPHTGLRQASANDLSIGELGTSQVFTKGAVGRNHNDKSSSAPGSVYDFLLAQLRWIQRFMAHTNSLHQSSCPRIFPSIKICIFQPFCQ